MELIDNNDYKEISLEVYIKYDYLEISELTSLLNSINTMHNKIIFRNKNKLTFEINEIPLKNVLAINQINTGQSIRFNFKEWLKPLVDIDLNVNINLNIDINANFNINVNLNKIGTQAAILYYLLNIANIQMQNKDIEKAIDKIKPIVENVNYKIPNKGIRSIENDANRFIENIYNNNNFYYVEINNVIIKDDRAKREAKKFKI